MREECVGSETEVDTTRDDSGEEGRLGRKHEL